MASAEKSMKEIDEANLRPVVECSEVEYPNCNLRHLSSSPTIGTIVVTWEAVG